MPPPPSIETIRKRDTVVPIIESEIARGSFRRLDCRARSTNGEGVGKGGTGSRAG